MNSITNQVEKEEEKIANYLMDTISRFTLLEEKSVVTTDYSDKIKEFVHRPDNYYQFLDGLLKKNFAEARRVSLLVYREKKSQNAKISELSK